MTELTIAADSEQVGRRIDQVLAEAFRELSRTEIQQYLRSGKVDILGKPITRPAYRVRAGDCIRWDVPDKTLLSPHPMSLSVLYEDTALIVVDKPSGLVVHPGAGTSETTLVEGLLVDRDLAVSDDPARPGVVHRLDKETSGIIVFAKTHEALVSLKSQFADRCTRKHYIAFVEGTFQEREGLIDAPIGRDPRRPQLRSIQATGRPSQTEFTVLSDIADASLLWIRPRTGRTHQIRVHLRYAGHPILGDKKYGGRSTTRLMLHAWRLVIRHPILGEPMEFRSPVLEVFPDYPYETLE